MKYFLAFLTLAVSVQAAGLDSSPTANEIVARMTERDAQRRASQGGYRGMRKYALVNKNRHAEMVVRVAESPDGSKQFAIVEESGSGAIRKHVFHKMLDEEAAATQPALRDRARITPANYFFEMAGTEVVDGRLAYVLDLTPKQKTKYLIVGRVWVDAEDFAMVRVEGKPAKRPSFWTRSVRFTHVYQRSGAYWYPVSNRSTTDALIFGRADLVIDYYDYAPVAALPALTAEVTK